MRGSLVGHSSARRQRTRVMSRSLYWVFSLILAVSSIALAFVVSRYMIVQLPPRKVFGGAEVTGRVSNVTIGAYDIRVRLVILSSNSSELKAGDPFLVRMTGIGPVDGWRCKSLKTNDVIRVRARFVENAFWEASDADWDFFK